MLIFIDYIFKNMYFLLVFFFLSCKIVIYKTNQYFFWKSFNWWCLFLMIMIVLYHQIKTSISFWCKRRLNPKSLIQPLKILPIKLTETHKLTNVLEGRRYSPFFSFLFFLFLIHLATDWCGGPLLLTLEGREG